MFKLTWLLTALLTVAAFGKNADDPNYPLEDRFHEIYKKFNSAPIPDRDWSKAYNVSQPREYGVAKTDTLWDISQVLFADPVFWPKIWSFNTDDILNPHEIYPGMKIRFFPGTMDAPPAVEIVEYEGVPIPPGKVRPPVAEIPPSIPTYLPEVPNLKLPEIMKLDRSAASRIVPLLLPVEIFDNSPDKVGKVVEIEDGLRITDSTREVFVALDDEAKPGAYTVIQELNHKGKGSVIQYRGEIKVLDRINDSENVYRARITKLLGTIELHNEVILGTIPVVDVKSGPRAPFAPFMRIIGGSGAPTDSLFSPDSVVFLDGGTENGIKEGDILNIYQDPRIRIGTTKQKRSYRQIGTVKVVKAQSEVSTGYILSSKTEVREGDLAGVEKTDSGTGSSSDEDSLILE